MRSTAEHIDLVLAHINSLAPLEVGLLGSVGCVLAEDVTIQDDEATQVLLSKGTTIAARHIALLAAAGLGRLWVHPKPRVVVVTVGDELVDPGQDPDRIPDINGVALTAAATAAGAMTFRVGPLQSNVDVVRASLEDQLVRADIIIAACGMSAPDYDLLTNVLKELGRVEFIRVAMQPGGAQGFGFIGPDSTPVFVLPGNPVGALLSFDIFVRPMIRRMMGQSLLHHKIIDATLEASVDSSEEDVHYIRAHLSGVHGAARVRSVENNEEHPLAGLGTADALIVVPAGTRRLSQGETVSVMRLDNQVDE
ncbi:MAG: gephyrin-like molybdotransferase Glp [Actinomycetes bacterium]